MRHPHRSPHEAAIEHLVYAMGHARLGNHKETHHNLQLAHIYTKLYAAQLKAKGFHDEAQSYLNHFDHHHHAIMKQLEDKIKKSDLEKGFDLPGRSASPARKEYMQTGVLNQMKLGQVAAQSGYNYKRFDEFSPEHQKAITTKFPGGGHSQYLYPTHVESGELAHAQRVPMREGMPKPLVSSHKIMPDHAPGSTVRIHSPESKMHGKLGIVGHENPNMPGKVPVRIGPSQAHTVYLESHQIKPAKAVNKVEKALVTLVNIQKALFNGTT